jgi:hypothetical protein
MIKISLADRYFIKFPLLELIMSHPIWKIGLFTKLSKDLNAECIECKKDGRTKCEFELSQLGPYYGRHNIYNFEHLYINK